MKEVHWCFVKHLWIEYVYFNVFLTSVELSLNSGPRHMYFVIEQLYIYKLQYTWDLEPHICPSSEFLWQKSSSSSSNAFSYPLADFLDLYISQQFLPIESLGVSPWGDGRKVLEGRKVHDSGLLIVPHQQFSTNCTLGGFGWKVHPLGALPLCSSHSMGFLMTSAEPL